MRIYEIEIRKFSFMVVCEDSDEAFKVEFLEGWTKHCKQMDIPVDIEFFDQLVEDYQEIYIPADLGCYRDMDKLS